MKAPQQPVGILHRDTEKSLHIIEGDALTEIIVVAQQEREEKIGANPKRVGD